MWRKFTYRNPTFCAIVILLTFQLQDSRLISFNVISKTAVSLLKPLCTIKVYIVFCLPIKKRTHSTVLWYLMDDIESVANVWIHFLLDIDSVDGNWIKSLDICPEYSVRMKSFLQLQEWGRSSWKFCSLFWRSKSFVYYISFGMAYRKCSLCFHNRKQYFAKVFELN